MSENTVNAALRRLGYHRTTLTAHGFRGMASILLHEQGWASDVIERQLSHAERNWPSFLGVSWTLLVPLATGGQLEAAISQCLAQADSRSGQLVDRLAAPVLEPDGPTRNAIRIAMEDFGRNAIAKVIPITRALLTAVGSGRVLGLPPVPSQR